MKKNILITFTHTEKVMKALHETFHVSSLRGIKKDEILTLCESEKIEALFISGGQRVDKELISNLPQSVKIIATSSVGFDHIDLKAASEKKIIVTNTPDVLSSATADIAMTLLLSVTRRMNEYSKIMHDGWGKGFSQNEMLGISLEGKTLGILGMGSIGQMMAKKARAFDMKIIYHNRTRLSKDLEGDAKYYEDFKKLLQDSDVVSLHAPATKETTGIMNKEHFSLMKDGSVFINTSRGNLVDEEALLDALDSKKLFGAGLDVFLNEPHFDKRFLNYPNVALAPHMGSATVETRDKMGLLVIENIKAVLEGKTPPTPVLF